ncbi:DUF4262 domain-containing protein [Glutamicibacter arilaitensis]|uniref:DUF4262 domain-containing protein n=1 Tax=Glutamicibacter arilaitensis TaxID=256701 RepID=UPI00384B9559
MEEETEVTMGIRCDLPLRGLVLLTKAEIDAKGFAILLCRRGGSQRVLGFTLGLTNLGHCEAMTVGGADDDVHALLSHLAEQVTLHGQNFDVGSQSTSLFKDLTFREAPDGLLVMEIVGEIYGEETPNWLQCDEPLSFASLEDELYSW